MNEIEKYLDQVCRTLGGSHDLREHVREELKDHLADAVEVYMSNGLSREDATAKAIADFGKPEETKSGLEALYGHSLTAFLVDRAMAWKERTMKSGWKWSSIAVLSLLAVMALQLTLTWAALVFIFPSMPVAYSMLGEPVPDVVSLVLTWARLFMSHGGMLFWSLLAAAIAAWVLFEWRSRSENKPVIRLACAAFASLLVTIVFSFTVVVTVWALANQAGSAIWQDPRRAGLHALSDAQGAVTELRRVMKAGNADAVLAADVSLRSALLRKEFSAADLVTACHAGDVDKVRSLIDRLLAQSLVVQETVRPEDVDELARTWELLVGELHSQSADSGPAALRPAGNEPTGTAPRP